MVCMYRINTWRWFSLSNASLIVPRARLRYSRNNSESAIAPIITDRVPAATHHSTSPSAVDRNRK